MRYSGYDLASVAVVMLLAGLVLAAALFGGIAHEPEPYAPQQPPEIRVIYVNETNVNEIIHERTVTRYSGEYQTYEVTAYTAGEESTGKTPAHPLYGVTASGATVEADHTVACPPSLPFGTRVYVPALNNVYTCLDRGSAITEGHLDIYMPDLDDALAFGRRQMDVLILPPMSGKESIE